MADRLRRIEAEASMAARNRRLYAQLHSRLWSQPTEEEAARAAKAEAGAEKLTAMACGCAEQRRRRGEVEQEPR